MPERRTNSGSCSTVAASGGPLRLATGHRMGLAGRPTLSIPIPSRDNAAAALDARRIRRALSSTHDAFDLGSIRAGISPVGSIFLVVNGSAALASGLVSVFPLPCVREPKCRRAGRLVSALCRSRTRLGNWLPSCRNCAALCLGRRPAPDVGARPRSLLDPSGPAGGATGGPWQSTTNLGTFAGIAWSSHRVFPSQFSDHDDGRFSCIGCYMD